MRIHDALTYHAAMAQAQPDHYMCFLHVTDAGEPVPVIRLPEGSEHIVLHVRCMQPLDHDYNTKHLLLLSANSIGLYLCDKNPLDGQVPCYRCKLY